MTQFRIMLRERNKPDWTLHNGPFESRMEAEHAGKSTVHNSGFDAFQVWELIGQQELQPQFVTTFEGVS